MTIKPTISDPTRLSVVMLHPEHRSHLPSVLIEGDKKSLKHLAQLILKVVADDDCGRGFGPGSDMFTAYSEMGLYFHRLPCVNGAMGRTDMNAAKIAAANILRRKRQLARATKRSTPHRRTSPER
jgi:hypothetical protein